MARRIPILNIGQSGANPGTFTIGVGQGNPTGNWTAVFQGRFYRDAAGNTVPAYSSPTPPAGYSLVAATTFSVVENASYAGRYTVFTKPSAAGLDSSSFSASQTVIRVNEPVGAPASPADLTSGFITNVSTYYLVVAGESAQVVPPGADLTSRPVNLLGRDFSGWAEVFQQNQLLAVQHFAGATAPASPFLGQIWYDTAESLAKVWTGTAWSVINSGAFAPSSSYRHIQVVPSDTWVIAHNLNVPAPFIVHTSVFEDLGGGDFKPLVPSDFFFDSANQLTITFSSPRIGQVLVRA